MPDRFDKAANYFRVGIIDEVFQIVGRRQYGFVARGDDVTETKASDVVQQADAKPAALRDDADIAGEAGRIAQLLQVGRAAVMRAQHPHAVRPAECDAAIATDSFDLRLQPAPGLAAFGETAVINDRSLDPALRRRRKGLEDALVAYAKGSHIGRLRQFRDVGVASATQHGRIIRVDREYRPGKAKLIKRGDQSATNRRFLG